MPADGRGSVPGASLIGREDAIPPPIMAFFIQETAVAVRRYA
jgi:hypothetical protein